MGTPGNEDVAAKGTVERDVKDKSVKQRVLENINGSRGRDNDCRGIAAELGIGNQWEAVRTALKRLTKEGSIRKIKRGRFARFTSQAPTREERIDKEHLLNKLVEAPERFMGKQLELHNFSFTLSIKGIKGLEEKAKRKGNPAIQWVKQVGRVSGVPVTIVDILNPIHSCSLYQKWTTPEWARLWDKKGGKSEQTVTSGGVGITFQVYGSGTFQAFMKASEKPMSVPEFFLARKEMSAMMKARCGYSFEDLRDFMVARFEFNNDTKQNIRWDGSEGFAVTVREADGFFLRLYSKAMDKEYDEESDVTSEYLRAEVGNVEGWQSDENLDKMMVAMMGGVNSQFLIRGQHKTEQALQKMMATMDGIGNAVQYLLAKDRKRGSKKSKKEN